MFLLELLQDAPSGLAKLELGRMKYSLLLLRAEIFLWDQVNQGNPIQGPPVRGRRGPQLVRLTRKA